jgi:pantothenate synthetase
MMGTAPRSAGPGRFRGLTERSWSLSRQPPLQFGPGEDLERYPRTLNDDLAICAEEGVDVVFAPAHEQMYPAEEMVTVRPGPMGELLEGTFRPGFFGAC